MYVSLGLNELILISLYKSNDTWRSWQFTTAGIYNHVFILTKMNISNISIKDIQINRVYIRI